MATGLKRIYWETNSLEDHVGLMRRQVHESLEEGEIRRITQKVMKGHADDTAWSLTGKKPVLLAWGKKLSMANVHAPASKNPGCLVIPMWNFVCNNLAYEPDPPGYDLFQTAEASLLRGAGDCDDSTILFGAMLHASRIARPFARVISTDGTQWSHVYAVAKFPGGGEIPLDPTVRGSLPGWEFPKAKSVRDLPL